MKKSLNFFVNIKLLQKLRNITDISLCKEVLHSLYGPSFKILELMVRPTTPRQTDGRTTLYHNNSRQRRAYKNRPSVWNRTVLMIVRLIDWMEFYAVSAIYQTCNERQTNELHGMEKFIGTVDVHDCEQHQEY